MCIRDRPWDSRRGNNTSSGWTRGPAGPEAIVNNRWLGASGGGCSSARPSGNAARRRQDSRRCQVALWRRGAAGSVISAESAPCGVLDVGGACWATLVAAAEASAEPVPLPEGTAKREAKAVSAAGNTSPRPGWQTSVVKAAVTRATNPPEGAERSPILIRGPYVRTPHKSEEAKGSPPKTAFSGWVPAHSNQHRGLERPGCEARKPG